MIDEKKIAVKIRMLTSINESYDTDENLGMFRNKFESRILIMTRTISLAS